MPVLIVFFIAIMARSNGEKFLETVGIFVSGFFVVGVFVLIFDGIMELVEKFFPKNHFYQNILFLLIWVIVYFIMLYSLGLRFFGNYFSEKCKAELTQEIRKKLKIDG